MEKRGPVVVDNLSCAVEDDASDWVSPCFRLHLWPTQRRCKPYGEEGTGRIIRWVGFTQGQNVKLPVRGGVRWQGMAGIDKSSTGQAWRSNWVGVEGQTQLVVGEEEGAERWKRPTELPGRALLPLLSGRRWLRLSSISVKTSQRVSCFCHC